MYDAYIIFEGFNREIAQRIHFILEKKYNLNVFIDEELNNYTNDELKEKLKNSLYLIVLYTKSFINHHHVMEELNYFLNVNKKEKVLVFSLDNSNFLNINNEILVVEKTKDIDKITKNIMKKMFDQNKIFSFKKFKKLFEIDSQNLLKEVIRSYIFLIIFWFFFCLSIIFFYKIPEEKSIDLLDGAITISQITGYKYIWEYSITKAINLLIESFPKLLSLFFGLSGLYWNVFFKLKKEYIVILSWFYNFNYRDLSIINNSLSMAIVMEFVMNLTQGKDLSNFAFFLLFIFFISYFFIAYLASILLKYEIAHLNNKFFIKIGKIEKNKIIDYIIPFSYQKYEFNNSNYEQCIKKDEEWLSFKMFLFAIVLFLKYWIYDFFIVPIKKLKFCKNNNILYIKEELKPYIK